MPRLPLCELCGHCHYKTFCPLNRKPIAKVGKKTLEYNKWRDKIAKPYLDKKYGHKCYIELCPIKAYLEVHHIQTRGGHHEKKQDLNNVIYLCGYHHTLVTNGELTVDIIERLRYNEHNN
jgi:hypothetical protein